MSELEWVRQQTEGQFFERKSCYEQEPGRVRARKPTIVAKDVAETLAAMANADGGTLVLGVENNGRVTGVDYPEDKLAILRLAPQRLVLPPLRATLREVSIEDKRILVYDVDWSSDVHQLTDGRYVLRVGDKNLPFAADQIGALKEGRRRRATEMRIVADATLEDLDLTLVQELAGRVGLEMPPENVLLRYRLVEPYENRLRITLAALLLFGGDPGRWHPRCGIDFVRYEGTERKVGDQLNIIRRERLEAPLVRLIQDAYRTVRPQLRERQRLVDLLFEERLEYPTFAWQEAIVNAVAHRDYGYEGLQVEIWMFDDRLEVRSPGELVEPVTLDRLLRQERIHASRNPRMVRVLTDIGYMRDLGEGIPRMFEVMEQQGLYPPELWLEAGAIFTVGLRNTPIYSVETLRWLAQFDALEISGHQKRLLVYAKEHDRVFTSRAYQRLVNIDIYRASQDIKDLIRKGLVRLPSKGGRVYELATPTSVAPSPDKPAEYLALEPVIRRQGYVTNADIRQALTLSRRQAVRVAERLVSDGWLTPEGERRARRYVPRE